MNRRPLAALAASVVALAFSAVPGDAADDGGTAATIVLSSTGALSITAPDDSTPINLATVDFGTGSGAATWPGAAANVGALLSSLGVASDASGQLGTMSVVDARVGLVTSWTSTVSWTDFSLSGASGPSEIIEDENLRYSSGAATTTGTGTFTPQLIPVQDGATAATYLGVLQLSGSNTVQWNPTIYIDLQDEVAGTYSGTITHSVVAS